MHGLHMLVTCNCKGSSLDRLEAIQAVAYGAVLLQHLVLPSFLFSIYDNKSMQ